MGACSSCLAPKAIDFEPSDETLSVSGLKRDSLHYLLLRLPTGYSIPPGHVLRVHFNVREGSLLVIHASRSTSGAAPSRFRRQWNTLHDTSLVSTLASSAATGSNFSQKALADDDDEDEASDSVPTGCAAIFEFTRSDCGLTDRKTASFQPPPGLQSRPDDSGGSVDSLLDRPLPVSVVPPPPASAYAAGTSASRQLRHQATGVSLDADLGESAFYRAAANATTYLTEPVCFYVALKTSKAATAPPTSVDVRTFVEPIVRGEKQQSADDMAQEVQLRENLERKQEQISVARDAEDVAARQAAAIAEADRQRRQHELQVKLQREKHEAEQKAETERRWQERLAYEEDRIGCAVRNGLRLRTPIDAAVSDRIASLVSLAESETVVASSTPDSAAPSADAAPPLALPFPYRTAHLPPVAVRNQRPTTASPAATSTAVLDLVAIAQNPRGFFEYQRAARAAHEHQYRLIEHQLYVQAQHQHAMAMGHREFESQRAHFVGATMNEWRHMQGIEASLETGEQSDDDDSVASSQRTSREGHAEDEEDSFTV